MSEEHKQQLAQLGESLQRLDPAGRAQVLAYAEGAAAIAGARTQQAEKKKD